MQASKSTDHLSTPRTVWLAAMADRATSEPAIRDLRDQFLEEGQRHLVELIRRGVAAGDLRPVADVRPLADMLSGAVAYRIAITGHAIDRNFLESVVDTLLAGIRKRRTRSTDLLRDRPPPFPVLVPADALERAQMRRDEGRALLLNASKPGYSERFTIEVEQYDIVVDALCDAAQRHVDASGEVLLKDLVSAVQAALETHPRFPNGRLTNFARYVKVDLEARGQLLRVPGSSPQRLRLAPAE